MSLLPFSTKEIQQFRYVNADEIRTLLGTMAILYHRITRRRHQNRSDISQLVKRSPTSNTLQVVSTGKNFQIRISRLPELLG